MLTKNSVKKRIADIPGARSARDELEIVRGYLADWRRYRKFSGRAGLDEYSLCARVVMDSHRIEKGLALSQPREWFGREVLQRLASAVEELPNSTDGHVVHAKSMALGAVDDYFSYFEPKCGSAPEWAEEVKKKFALFLGLDTREGGIKPLSLPRGQVAAGFKELVSSRESVRSFSEDAVPVAEIEAAAMLASTSPSVCNRQGSLCRIVPRGPEADRILKHQNGNKGFGSDASHVLLITHDLRTMLTPGERNQAYVDGGLYAMTLLYALHASGIGACCLNWSATRAQDHGLRREIDLPEHELVIMMIAVGYPADDAHVTVSPLRADRHKVGI
ncbi:nitroreductase family protein [Gordonia sp. zg691]|uniref:nitroreductase family protein n=1 Tax=Gordonia jinghuaiqii TaxID=2758710 RepID=UPI0016624D63|nr:nitroreductase family protein [Gordonia jinghuaiqii]MBD0863960.1 nitroreductase family protein [Gordonia jinghuaiqii]